MLEHQFHVVGGWRGKARVTGCAHDRETVTPEQRDIAGERDARAERDRVAPRRAGPRPWRLRSARSRSRAAATPARPRGARHRARHRRGRRRSRRSGGHPPRPRNRFRTRAARRNQRRVSFSTLEGGSMAQRAEHAVHQCVELVDAARIGEAGDTRTGHARARQADARSAPVPGSRAIRASMRPTSPGIRSHNSRTSCSSTISRRERVTARTASAAAASS